MVDGEYSIEVTALPPSLRDRYLKSPSTIRIAGQPVTDFEIVLGARGGQLEGAALSNAAVVLVPEQRNRTDLYKSVTSDASGRFRFEGITPGKYLLFAWEDVESDIWYNPEFIRAIEDRGKAIAIVEGSRETLDATVIPMR
jgi:hypothetical protein